MKIGVVSDTHNHLGNVTRIVELLNSARVDRVVHTGDITQAKTLEVFSNLEAPLCGVFGNNDQERVSLGAACTEYGFHFTDPPLRFEWSDRSITVVHDPLDIPSDDQRGPGVVLHGHTHRQVIERGPERIVFNPGECAGHMVGFNAIGVLDLATLDTEILKF